MYTMYLRDETVHSIYENAEFSPKVIKDSIREGESKTKQIIDEIAKIDKQRFREVNHDKNLAQPPLYVPFSITNNWSKSG